MKISLVDSKLTNKSPGDIYADKFPSGSFTLLKCESGKVSFPLNWIKSNEWLAGAVVEKKNKFSLIQMITEHKKPKKG